LQGKTYKANSELGSGRVRCFSFSNHRLRITQITTFCPDIIGPGPCHQYLVDNGEVLILFDTGIPTHLVQTMLFKWRNQPMPPEVKALPPDHSERELREGLKLAGYAIKDINFLVVSHGHADHYTMGPTILGEGDIQTIAHIHDTPEICNPWGMLNLWISRRPQMMATGMPPPRPIDPSFVRTFDKRAPDFSFRIDWPVFVEGPLRVKGSEVRGIAVKHLPGHSPGSISLIIGDGEARVLLCGDTILFPITPHPNDLLLYLRTLEDLEKLENIALALPGHGKAVRDLKGRVIFLKKHHRGRLRCTYEACKKPRSVWDIATMHRYFDVYVDPAKFNPLAGTEALVHMELLKMVDGLDRVSIHNGVHYFQNCGEPFELVYGRITDLVRSRDQTSMMRY